MRLAVTGTDTDVGKTVFAAGLAGALDAFYWKPIQAGLDPPTDSETVAELSGLKRSQILFETYRLRNPLSIHRAAELDGIEIDVAKLKAPPAERLVIEGAGGALVPITRRSFVADLLASWNLPIVVVARTTLGTINHTLMTLECLRTRGLLIHGVAFVGDANADSERTICEAGRARRLGRLPWLDPLDGPALWKAFAANFNLEDFR